MTHMTKEDALRRIEELKRYVEDLDKPKVTIDMIKPGAVFIWNSKLANEPLTIIGNESDDEWLIGGVNNNPFHLYSTSLSRKCDTYKITKAEMVDRLINDYVYIGTRTTTLMQDKSKKQFRYPYGV